MALPKTLGGCADKLFRTRAKRLDVQKQVDKLRAEEAELKEHLINNLPKDRATGVQGKLCQVSIVTKQRPKVEDWDRLYKYIKRTGNFDLLQRRLSDPAIRERWEDGKEVPGVDTFTVVDVSIRKAK